MRITVVLLLALPVALGDDYEEEPVKVSCEDRCLRIHERSLDRIGFSKTGADRFIDKPKADGNVLREVCWKEYDYFYCMKGCVKSIEHEKYVRHVKSRCKNAVEDLESGLSCLFKYRSFLEIRCSSFLNEAIRLKQADDPDLLPDKETCRYLHLNALCLENSVSSFCPQATSFFRRLNLRDFFLNHILPADDELFDDQDLDACQLKDFVKEALEGVKVSPRRYEEEEETTTTTSNSSSSKRTSSTSDDEDTSEEAWPASSTAAPAVIRTLSPSTRAHSPLHTSTASNFVYTTPTRKQPSSTLIGTSTTPIYISREQAIRTSTARGGGEVRGQRITVTPKSHTTTTTTTPRPTTTNPSSTTSRRRLFDSDEDFSQTPPNFLWGSFRGENYKLARNYSESFPPDAEFVTPVTLESSSLFGDDDDDDSHYEADGTDYGNPQVIYIDREPVTVTGRPVQLSTIVTLVDEKRRTTTHKKVDEDRSWPVYEHAVDTQLQPTTDVARPLPLGSAERATTVPGYRATGNRVPTRGHGTREPEGSRGDGTTESDPEWTRGKVLPTDDSAEWTTVSKILPTDADDDIYDDDGVPVDENEIRRGERKKTKETKKNEEVEEEEKRTSTYPDTATHGFAVVSVGEEARGDDDERKEAENNFDRALQIEKEEEDDSNEIQTDVAVAVDEPLDLQPATTSTRPPDNFTPLINGGRVAVKSIKQFRAIGEEESAQDWTEDPNLDDSHVVIDDFDDYDKETYIASEVRPDDSPRDAEVRRRINFILAYTSLFFILLLLVVCCILVVIVKNRRNASMDQRYKMHDSL